MQVENEKMHPVNGATNGNSDNSSDDTRSESFPALFEACDLPRFPKKLTRIRSQTDDQTAHHGDGEDMEEYQALLAYVAKSAERKAGKTGVNSDGSYEKKHRLWYAPWKTKTIKYDKNDEAIQDNAAMQTPDDWCVYLLRYRSFSTRTDSRPSDECLTKNRLETETGQGLTDAQVEERRKVMGFNELESYVAWFLLFPVFLPPATICCPFERNIRRPPTRWMMTAGTALIHCTIFQIPRKPVLEVPHLLPR